MKKATILGTIVGAALLTAAPFSLQWAQKTVTLSLDSADARVGRPLTPGSVAGVNRRVHRRAAYTQQLLPTAPGRITTTGTPATARSYGYRPGYPAARRVAIHRARWH